MANGRGHVVLALDFVAQDTVTLVVRVAAYVLRAVGCRGLPLLVEVYIKQHTS